MKGEIMRRLKMLVGSSSVPNQSGRRTWCCGMLAVMAALLLWAWPATAGEKQAVENMAITIDFDSGQTSATPSGNVHIRNLRAVYMVLSDNPLVAGRLTVVGDFNADAQLNGVGSGKSTFEIGTWDLSTGAPVFIPSPTGGLFLGTWESKGNLAGPFTVQSAGHGVAGEVEGMQFNAEGQAPDALSSHYTGWLLDPHAKK
jgi:hypothetical protein